MVSRPSVRGCPLTASDGRRIALLTPVLLAKARERHATTFTPSAKDIVDGGEQSWRAIFEYLELSSTLRRFVDVPLRARYPHPKNPAPRGGERRPVEQWTITLRGPVREAWRWRYLRRLGERRPAMGYDPARARAGSSARRRGGAGLRSHAADGPIVAAPDPPSSSGDPGRDLPTGRRGGSAASFDRPPGWAGIAPSPWTPARAVVPTSMVRPPSPTMSRGGFHARRPALGRATGALPLSNAVAARGSPACG